MFGKITPLADGTHDSLYNVPVFVTTQVATAGASAEGTGYRCALMHKRAIAYALGNLPMDRPNSSRVASGVRFSQLPAEALRETYVADIMYGGKTVGGSYRGVRLISKN